MCLDQSYVGPVVKWELKMFSPFSNQAVFFGEDLTAADTIVPGSERPKWIEVSPEVLKEQGNVIAG